jgi:hypothetical protein
MKTARTASWWLVQPSEFASAWRSRAMAREEARAREVARYLAEHGPPPRAPAGVSGEDSVGAGDFPTHISHGHPSDLNRAPRHTRCFGDE